MVCALLKYGWARDDTPSPKLLCQVRPSLILAASGLFAGSPPAAGLKGLAEVGGPPSLARISLDRGLPLKDRSGPDSTCLQLEQARQLLDLGHHREALTLALEALLQELHHLRASLVSLRNLAQPQPEAPREEPQASLPGRLGAKPRLLH
jgi:hypothetical protein